MLVSGTSLEAHYFNQRKWENSKVNSIDKHAGLALPPQIGSLVEDVPGGFVLP